MITKTKTKDLNSFFVSSSDVNKSVLLSMAKKGENKPSKHSQNRLFNALKNYTTKKCSAYDKDFTLKIKKFAPHWFISRESIVKKNKQIIIREARKGVKRPTLKTKIGKLLAVYVRKSSHCYDKDLFKLLKKIAPHWFITQVQVAYEKKKEIIKLAKSGADKPLQNSMLGKALITYYYPSFKSYDPEFVDTIKNLRPDWFVNKTDIANITKNRLIELARNKKPKPKSKTVLYRNLVGYCYRDKFFAAKLKKLAPDWFISQTEKLNKKKKELVKLAKSGKDRPNEKTPLGLVLIGCGRKDRRGDVALHRLLKKLRPDWFAK